jgi:hypothetical protein
MHTALPAASVSAAPQTSGEETTEHALSVEPHNFGVPRRGERGEKKHGWERESAIIKSGAPILGSLSGSEGVNINTRHGQNNRPSGGTNINFEAIFSEDAILRTLVRLRLRTAERRHETQRLLDLSADAPGLPDDADWLGVFPPRGAWHAVREQDRPLDSGKSSETSLLRAVRKGLRATPPTPWAVKLRALIHKIRTAALAPDGHRFSEPTLLPFAKATPNEFRIAATMSNPVDKVVDRLLGAYLREVVDPQLAAGVVAYRAATGPDREDAILQLVDFRRRHAGTDLFVAEVDIQAFFDCVPHSLALRVLDQAPLADQIDPRARATLAHFLGIYDRPSLRGREPELRASHRLSPEATFPWPAERLADFYGDLASVRIGLPQGTAISTVLANLVLHEADQASLAALHASDTGEAAFFRYCDDAIWVGVNAASVAEAQRAFQETLLRLRLPMHPPEAAAPDAAFFHQKSKLPYRWSERGGVGFSRWIAFLGYQIDAAGQLRIRKDSLTRLRRRMAEEVEEVVELARRPGLRLSLPGIFRRTAGRLLALSTGRLNWRLCYQDPAAPCWSKAFRLAGAKGPVRRQLRGLDHQMHRQMEHLFRQLLRLAKTNEERDDLRAAASTRLPPSEARSFVTRFGELKKSFTPPPLRPGSPDHPPTSETSAAASAASGENR